MADAYRSSDPEIPCSKHPEIAASTSCRRCGALICDGCRTFVRGTQICTSCRAPARFSASTVGFTCAAVAGLLCVLAAFTRRTLVDRSSPSPVTSTLDAPAIVFSLDSPQVHGAAPRCVGDDCFYPLRVLF